MTFLPIVDRELRVAARRKSTYRFRTWTAVVALGVVCFSIFPMMLMRGPGSVGKPLYANLTGFAFGLCLLAGALLTADCLSAEKRDGTLGFLFLTDLKGYDVVLGKFMAMSLNAVYGLLAVLPITGLSLLLGGLTGGEFWRTTLALCNALFFSLAAGILVSAIGRDSQRVMGGTLALVILLAGGVPVLVKVGLAMGVPRGWECVAWVSPYYSFGDALEPMYQGQPSVYWCALLSSQLLGWCLLALASFAVPHRWQEHKEADQGARVLAQWPRRSSRRPAERARAREELLPVNPVLWLMSSGPDFRRISWVIVCAWGAMVLLATVLAPRDMAGFTLSWYGVRPFGFLLKWLLALQACRFFAEGRRDGALELLLSTPLTTQDILRGQMLALKKSFLRPIVWLLALLFVPVMLQVVATRDWITPEFFFGFVASCFYCLRMYADCYAVIWFGMWLALTLKRPGLAAPLTILFVLVLPTMLCMLDVLADLFFILWGMTQLRHKDLRLLLARQFEASGAGRLGGPAR